MPPVPTFATEVANKLHVGNDRSGFSLGDRLQKLHAPCIVALKHQGGQGGFTLQFDITRMSVKEFYGFAKMLVDKDDERTDLPPGMCFKNSSLVVQYMTIQREDCRMISDDW